MGRTQIISKSTVCAAIHKEPNLRIDLTPWDLKLLQFDAIQKGLLFREPPKDNTNTGCLNLIPHLKTSLSRTLDYFPTLAGRLATTEHHDGSNTVSVYINCNNAGAEFVHAIAAGVSVADIITPVYVPNDIVYSFFPLNGVTNCQCISKAKPLLGVQVTELVDGIFIACTINHSVVDGTSFWHFFNSWSEISRGSDCISKVPSFEPGFLSESEYFPIRLPLGSIEPSGTYSPPPNLQQRVFHFTKENIAKLKENANAEIGSTNKISSLQAIFSHIWRSVTRTRSPGPDEEVHFMFGMGFRQRLQQPLPPEYFGNAAQGVFVSMKARDQLEQGLGNVALKMNMFIAAYTDEKIKNFLESWGKNPEVLTWESLPMKKNNCFVSSSPRFNFYGNDFGWGRPIAVRSGPANKADGKITLFAGVEEGSVDVEACFLPETVKEVPFVLSIVMNVSEMQFYKTRDQIEYVALQTSKIIAVHMDESIRDSLGSWRENPPCGLNMGKPDDGKITLFIGVEEGNVDVESCFLPETLQGMRHDTDFLPSMCQRLCCSCNITL